MSPLRDMDMPSMSEEEQYEIRKFLAIAHEDGVCRVYGDDGELQCGNFARHGRTIDFRREKISDLLNIVMLTRMREYSERIRANGEGER